MSDVSITDKKGQLVIVISAKTHGKVYLRKPENLKEWYQQILDNVSANKFQHTKRKLHTSISLIQNDQHLQKSSNPTVHSRPHMGVSSFCSVRQGVKTIGHFY